MSRLSKHHMPKAGVEGKCSVPMWMDGCPSGFCDRAAFGEQYDEDGRHAPHHWPRRNRYGFYPPNSSHLRKPFAMALCCDWHGGPKEGQIRFMRDGDAWCAFMPGFENLQESEAGFGETQADAEKALLAAIAKARGVQA